MSAKKVLNIQPIQLGTSVANLLNCNVTSLSGPVGFTMTQPYLLVTRARVINTDSVPRTCSFFKGATAGSAAGTEVFGSAQSIPATSYVDLYVGDGTRLDAADFLTGNASVASKLTLELEAEIGISG
jgi:hypothetical protein